MDRIRSGTSRPNRGRALDMSASSLNVNAVIDLDAPLEQLWPLISDTDRVNRLVGLPAFERADPDQELTQLIHGHYLGLPVTWREYPFEWVFEQWFQVRRDFMPPLPVERLVTGARLTPLSERRTAAGAWVELRPRNIVGWAGARLYIGNKMMRDLLRVYRSLGALAVAAEQVVP